MEKYKWSYGRKPKNNKVFKTLIKLPVLKDKNDKIYIDSEKSIQKDMFQILIYGKIY